LTISASLAQIGEFSFILAALGVTLGILPPEGRDLILAGAILSIVLNPAIFWLAEWLRPGLEARFPPPEAEPALYAEPELTPRAGPATPVDIAVATPISGHTVLIGYGRVGTVVAEGLLAAGRPFVLIEDAEGRIAAAHAAGIEVVVGNAASPEVLRLANVAGAATVIIAIPNAFEAGQATEQCRRANADAVIIARAHFDEEVEHLRHLGATTVITGEREIALSMLERIRRDAAVEPVVPPAEPEAPAAEPITEPLEPLPETDASAEPLPLEPEEVEPAVAAVDLPPPIQVRQPARFPASPFATELAKPPAAAEAPAAVIVPPAPPLAEAAGEPVAEALAPDETPFAPAVEEEPDVDTEEVGEAVIPDAVEETDDTEPARPLVPPVVVPEPKDG
jgi:CPA2 family monovalent cation:H+ antiporter-2